MYLSQTGVCNRDGGEKTMFNGRSSQMNIVNDTRRSRRAFISRRQEMQRGKEN